MNWTIPDLSRRQIATIAMVALLFSGGAVAASYLFTAGSGTAYETESGLIVKTNTDHGIVSGNPFTGTDDVRINNVSFSASGEANVTVDRFEGEWTNVSSLKVASNDVTINPDDKQRVTVGGDATSLQFSSMTVDDGSVDFIYSGSSGSASVTVAGLPANIQLGAVDQNGNLIATATSDGNGVATFSGMDSSSTHEIRLVTPKGGPSATNLQPQGDLDSEPSEFSVNVSDPDFSNGDEVDVVFSVDGSQFNSQTITSNQTVTATPPSSAQTGGQHNWTVEVTDGYGTTNTAEASYKVPDTLFIRNETDPDQLIADQINITVRFFGEDEIFERTTQDGTLNMTGLPVNQPFIVEIGANETYYDRTIYITDIYTQQTVYLLNRNVTSIEARLTLDDPTGQYDSQSIVTVQKPITRNGTTTWRAIHADRFGVEGVTANLEEGTRYNIVIRNEGGKVQEIGPYRADVTETVTVSPGTPTIEFDDYSEGWNAGAELRNDTLEYRYSDPANQTSQLTVYIHEKGNTSNQLVPNQTYSDVSDVSAIETLTANQTEKTWVVNFIANRDGEEVTKRIEVSNRPELLPPDLDQEWRLITGVLLLLISAGVFSILNASVGGVVVAIEGGLLWWTGWLDGATTGAGVVLALFIAVLAHVYSSRQL